MKSETHQGLVSQVEGDAQDEHSSSFWAPLEEAIQDGRMTPHNGMRFSNAIAELRRHFRPTPELDFQRALFRYLKQRLSLDTFAEVAQRFEFTEAETPLDDVELSPELIAALEESKAKARAAEIELEQARAAQAKEFERRARADALKVEIVRLEEEMTNLNSLKEALTAEATRLEASIRSEVYDMPKWSNFPDKFDFIVRRQSNLIAIRSTLAEHAERLKVSKAILAQAKAEFEELAK